MHGAVEAMDLQTNNFLCPFLIIRSVALPTGGSKPCGRCAHGRAFAALFAGGCALWLPDGGRSSPASGPTGGAHRSSRKKT